MRPLIRMLFTKSTIIIATLFVSGLALFLSIYNGVQQSQDLALFDEPLLAWVISHQNAQITTLMRVITDLMSPIAVVVASITIAGTWAYRKKELWRPALLIGAITLAFSISSIIKAATARARPTLTDLLETHAGISYSFPSGHTIGVATLLMVLAYFAYRQTPTFKRTITWISIVFFGTALVAFSRIYLGYHWLTDVTASVGLSLMIVAIVAAIDSLKRRRAASTASASALSNDR